MDVQLTSGETIAQTVLNQLLKALVTLAYTNNKLLGKVREYASSEEYQYSKLFTLYIETFTKSERRLLVARGIFNYEGHPRMNEDAQKVVRAAITGDERTGYSVGNPVADRHSDEYAIADDYINQRI